MTSNNDITSFQKWYGRNSENLSRKRKEQYANDPEFREKALARAKDYRNKKKNGHVAQKTTRYRNYNGTQQQVFTTGGVADSLGCGVTTIINWESKDWIPLPIFDEPHRFYLQHQVTLMKNLHKAVETKKAKQIATAIEKVHDNWA